MTNSQALILGVVQGLTEYLPVSSSAHLVLVPKLMGWNFDIKEAFVFDVLVQLGTLVGVFIYFAPALKEVIKSVLYGIIHAQPAHDDNSRLGWLVVMASIPAAVIGLGFKEEFTSSFTSAKSSSYFLILTAIILAVAELLTRVMKTKPNRFDALVMGCAQVLAIFPGVSRSGATIATGMVCGLSRQSAAQFSFLMSIPVLMGASLIASLELVNNADLLMRMVQPLILGFTSAAVIGFFVIRWFMTFLAQRRLIWFSIYCFLLGVLGVLYFN